MNIVIISTSHPQQQAFWERRLTHEGKSILKPGTIILSILEDWPGGAGNGFGTLYAYKKAKERFSELYNADLDKKLQEGASVSIYHTAGYGKRIVPLVSCEQGNKSAVKLPGYIDPSSTEVITILEAVIKQTSTYAPYLKGRLSVFWGDQIFIPAILPKEPIKSHVAILCRWEKFPSEKEWMENRWSDYGLLLRTGSKSIQHMDKIDYKSLESLVAEGLIEKKEGLGLSLGSFSISFALLKALESEFKQELKEKKGQMDTDPHFWMPTSLSKNHYIKQMASKKMNVEDATKHYSRMQKFLDPLLKEYPINYLEALDIGSSSYWWDFGITSKYYQNVLKVLKNDDEAKAMRTFFGLPSPQNHSCIIGSEIKNSTVENSVLINVKADLANIKNSVVICSSIQNLNAEECLLYNIHQEDPMTLPPFTVRADTFIPEKEEHICLYTSLSNDGKNDWSKRLPKNIYSYEEMLRLTQNLDPYLVKSFSPH
jgi:hypothetical protein